MKWPVGKEGEAYNPYEEWDTSKGQKYSDFYMKMVQATMVKLDSLEDYEEKSLYSDEIVGFIYDIMDGCTSVFGVPPAFLRYCSKKFKAKPIGGTAGTVDHAIESGIREQDLDIDDVPLIPIVEYKLVPTGYINWYDPHVTRKARSMRRLRYKDATLGRKRVYKKQENKGGRPKKQRPEEVPVEIQKEEEDDE